MQTVATKNTTNCSHAPMYATFVTHFSSRVVALKANVMLHVVFAIRPLPQRV
jgi:hypothetical protein